MHAGCQEETHPQASALTLDQWAIVVGNIEVPGSVSDPVMCGESNLDLPVFETYLTTHPVPSKAYEY